MNIYDFKSLTDEELNELAAIKIMEWTPAGELHGKAVYTGEDENKYVNYTYDGPLDWEPTSNMNNAMKLIETLGDGFNFELNRKPSGVDHLLYEARLITPEKTYSAIDGCAARSITITALLAKESEGK